MNRRWREPSSSRREGGGTRSGNTRGRGTEAAGDGAHGLSDSDGPGPLVRDGSDRVQFLVSANAGEEPRPLDRVASGGELSRVALALKTCLVGTSGREFPARLFFDEIDTGIGGRAAEGVARRLQSARRRKIRSLCVTHLAQIACFADHHYRVGKFERARPHRGGNRGTGRRREHRGDRPYAERTEAYPRSYAACRRAAACGESIM